MKIRRGVIEGTDNMRARNVRHFLSLLCVLVPSLTFAQNMVFNGSNWYPNPARGATNQRIGWFILYPSSGPSLSFTALTTRLEETRTGLSNFKLWYTSDFNSPYGPLTTQLGGNVAVDPGTNNSIGFSGFTYSVPNTGAGFLVTADVAANATGNVRPWVTGPSSVGATGSTPTSNSGWPAPLANIGPLPVTLSLFAVE
jgi:hypothetical protein